MAGGGAHGQSVHTTHHRPPLSTLWGRPGKVEEYWLPNSTVDGYPSRRPNAPHRWSPRCSGPMPAPGAVGTLTGCSHPLTAFCAGEMGKQGPSKRDPQNRRSEDDADQGQRMHVVLHGIPRCGTERSPPG